MLNLLSLKQKSFTVDEVVFAEKGDLLLLGARSLEGMNLTVDPRRKKLVAGQGLLFWMLKWLEFNL